MPPGKKDENAPPGSGSDLIGSLPDHILHHLLSFLPVQAAVQTCVLARRWRHLWRSTTGLRIVGLDSPKSAEDLSVLVDHVLILRERTDLDTVEMIFDQCDDEAESSKFVKLWTRFAVMSKVRALTLHSNAPPYLCLDVPPFVSQHLRTIDLEGLRLQQNVLDFNSCPALEDLKMKHCNITVEKISSHSLKHLSITKCRTNLDRQLRVSTPGLISLKLDHLIGKTPFLENMMLLKTACVNLSKGCQDFCLNYYPGGVFCGVNNNGCDEAESSKFVKLWTCFAVMSKVRALTLHSNAPQYLCLDVPPFVSQHLRTIDLEGLRLQQNVLDFNSCPALEDLKMKHCNITVEKISSHSLKHLSITKCRTNLDRRLRVSTSGLISLKLDRFTGKTPFLENMALLQTACVNLGEGCHDVCLNYYPGGVSCGVNNNGCENCLSKNDGSSHFVLLGGISSAKHLGLISEFGKFIFTRDLKHGPTFSKLKTLLLNEYWCTAPDLDPLACILKNSPVLEKLTLQLFSKGPNHRVEMKGGFSSMERPSAISEHLNIVEVKCAGVDERILKVLKFLCAFDIRFSF